jgi:hypothetical protein
MKSFIVHGYNLNGVDMWCWRTIGPGGYPLRRVVGSHEYDDPWDGDFWQRQNRLYVIKEDKHAIMFALRWCFND